MAVTGQPPAPTDEQVRLRHSPGDDDPWRLWGPYLSARQWGTVREDYSDDGDAWAHFPFDQAHARAYRWGEDGIAGLTDRYGFLNLAVAAWNHRDDRLKERLFGLTNAQATTARTPRSTGGRWMPPRRTRGPSTSTVTRRPPSRTPRSSRRTLGAARTPRSSSSPTPGCSRRAASSTS